jgi:hypothetical protein
LNKNLERGKNGNEVGVTIILVFDSRNNNKTTSAVVDVEAASVVVVPRLLV